MNEIYAHAPIQARPDTISKLERMFPLLASEAVNRVYEYKTQNPQKRVDIWNTVGRKTDLAHNADTLGISRYDFNTNQIQARYTLLAEIFGIKADNRIVLRDDDTEYSEIILDKINDLVQQKILKVEPELFSQCESCGQIIAPSSVSIGSCRSCGDNKFDTVVKNGLFLYIDQESRKKIAEFTNITPLSERRRLKSMVANIPKRIQLSKHRDYGTRLASLGVSHEFVFDPKTALALAGIVLKEAGYGNLDLLVHGPLALTTIIPYALTLDKECSTKFVSLSLVPPFGIKNVNESLVGFYSPFLPLLAMSGGSLGIQQSEAFRNEHFKTVKRFERAKELARETLFKVEKGMTSRISSLDVSCLADVINLISERETRKAVLSIREFVYTRLNEQYFSDCIDQGLVPDLEAISAVEEVYHLIYG